jgi:predicted nucleic acid-binding protein
MSVRSFVDSNILIYAHDVRQGEKHTIAMRLVYDLIASRSLVLSPQVLQEFYVNVTRKIAKPLTKPMARQIIEDLAVWSVDTGPADIASAFRIEDEAKISFWDALICASALKAGAQVVFSEDLNSGQMIAGLRIENPLQTLRS